MQHMQCILIVQSLPGVHPAFHMSITCWYCSEMAELFISYSMLDGSLWILWFLPGG